MRSIFRIYLATASVALLPTLAAAQSVSNAPPPNAQSTNASAAESADVSSAANDTAQLAAQLVDPAVPQPIREEVARRLATRRTAEANRTLLAALSDPNPGGQLAVAQALSEVADPLPDFITPLFASLGTNDRVTEKATAALVNYRDNESVLTRLIDLAGNRGRGSSEMIRGWAIHSLGALAEKRSAAALIALVRNVDDPLRGRAEEALAAMTGIYEFGQDATSWSNWWDAESKRDDDASFRNEMLQRVAGQFVRQQTHVSRLAGELKTTVQEFYRATTSASDKERLLKRFLTSSEPETRVAAVELVNNDALDAKPVPPEVAALMRQMIGDSNPDVRIAVARAIRNTNDKAALDGLLAQATQETNAAVRGEIAASLGPIGDLKAVPTLLRLLDDSSHLVAKNAAQSLFSLGAQIRSTNPQLASNVAMRLKALIDRTATSPADSDLRVAAVHALVPLKAKELNSFFYTLLKPSIDPSIRRNALAALGSLENPESAGAIVDCLNDPDPTVVLAAVIALGQVSPPPEMLNPLRQLIDPNTGHDSSIRVKAIEVLSAALPTFSKEQLTQWGDFFAGIKDPNSRIRVLQVLADKLGRSKDSDALATVQQQIADEYVAQSDSASAVPYYRNAYEFRKAQSGGGMMTLNLITQLLKALLVSGKYAEATAFASDQVASNSNQELVGQAIVNQANVLSQSDKPDDLRKAQSLIDLAGKMHNPLAEKYLGQLETMRKSVEQQLEQANSPSTTRPRSAVESVAVEWFDRSCLV